VRTAAPNNARVHALYGRLLAQRNDMAGAIREFDRALEIEPGNTLALTGRVGADVVLKKPAEARARISRALAASPNDPDVLFLAGRLEASVGDNQAAEKYFRRTIDANPASLGAYTALGQIYLRMKRLDDARVEFEKLATLRPDAVGAKTMVGIIYDIQNKPQDARRAYEEVVRATNRAPVAANNLAWNYAETGENLDMALQLAQSAKQQLPDSHEVDDTLGWVYMKRNLPDLAIPAFERCVKASPEVPEYHYHLGAAYAKVGRAADARRSLERALQLRLDFKGADDARAMLASLKS
jgi:tetratricopeptide (TPR) repeat protein